MTGTLPTATNPACASRPGSARSRPGRRAGFTLIELAVVLVVLGLLIGPLLVILEGATEAQDAAVDAARLEQAKSALIAFAANHNGCLPTAADFEGGIIDTNNAGNAGHSDTGQALADQRAGDLPWATLGLGSGFLDADQTRLQYYVSTVFADADLNTDRCAARDRSGPEAWRAGIDYDQNDVVVSGATVYLATGNPGASATLSSGAWTALAFQGNYSATTAYAAGDYVLYDGGLYRAKVAVTGTAPTPIASAEWLPVSLPGLGWSPPIHFTGETYQRGEIVRTTSTSYFLVDAATESADPPGGNWQDISLAATDRLALRRGPDVSTSPGNTVSSAQNVFVLIAPGTNENADRGRVGFRDASHRRCTGPTSCTDWSQLSDDDVDDAVFAADPDPANDPADDDALLVMSYLEFRAEMAKFGYNLLPLAY